MRPARRALVVAVVIINLLVVALLAYALRTAREQRELEVRSTLDNVTLLVDHSITEAASRIDVALREMVDELERQLHDRGKLGERDVDELLADRRTWVAGIAEFRVVDASGAFIYGRDVKPGERVSIADHRHFIRHSRADDAGMLVSNPQQGRLVKGWIISFSRRYDNPDGSFAGIVSGAVPVSYFSQLLSGVDLGPKGLVVVRGGDAALIARYPPLQHPSQEIGSKILSSELAGLIASGVPSAPYSTAQAGDGIERVNSFRRVAGLPFYVVAGMGKDDYLGQWRADVWKTALIVFLFLTATGVSAWLLWRALYLTEKASERSRILLRHSSDGVHILDAELRVAEVSDSFCRMLGYERAEMLGMHVSQWDAKYSLAEIAAIADGGQQRGEIHTLETRHRRKDGTTVEVEVTICPLELDGLPMLFNSARDITGRKQMEQALLKTTDLLRQTQQIARIGGWEYDVAADKMVWTDEVYRIYDVEPDYDPGQRRLIAEFYPPAVREMVLTAFRNAVERGEPFQFELPITTARGTAKWIRTEGRAERIDGQVRRIFGDITDITERKHAEEVRASLEEQLHRAHKMEALGRMAGRIAHEISNALQPVMSHASLAGHACAGNEAALGHLASIKEGVRHGREIIRSVLAIAGGRAVARKPCRLEAEVTGIMNLIVAGIRADVTVETELQPAGGAVWLSASELFQIVDNLVNNSVDAIAGKGRIRVATGPAALDEAAAAALGLTPGAYAELTVSDTGSGMEEDALLRAFDPFFTTKPVNKGSGLGLWTVRSLVESMDGRIRIVSAPGQGTTVRIVLPLTP